MKGEVIGGSDRLKNKGSGYSTRQAIKTSRDESGRASGREGEWNLEWVMEQGVSYWLQPQHQPEPEPVVNPQTLLF